MTEDGRRDGFSRELVVLLPLLDPLADKELPLESKEALSENPESLSGLSVLPPTKKKKSFVNFKLNSDATNKSSKDSRRN
jgi:hypothetical protein